MIWRQMVTFDPDLASQAAMYWRLLFLKNPEFAAKKALLARKMTSIDPERNAELAMLFRNEEHLNPFNITYKELKHKYWRKFAGHDPEVTARSAKYWIQDSEADMYW